MTQLKLKKKNRKSAEILFVSIVIVIVTIIIVFLLNHYHLIELPWDQEQKTEAEVTRVIDGDTIIVELNGTEERVRLIGVDTPESVHPDSEKNVPFGTVASDFTKDALLGNTITMEFDAQERDQYGRLLAYVYLDGKMFNKILLEEGMATVATYPPNVRYVDDFTALQKEAREAGVGLWDDSADQKP